MMDMGKNGWNDGIDIIGILKSGVILNTSRARAGRWMLSRYMGCILLCGSFLLSRIVDMLQSIMDIWYDGV